MGILAGQQFQRDNQATVPAPAPMARVKAPEKDVALLTGEMKALCAPGVRGRLIKAVHMFHRWQAPQVKSAVCWRDCSPSAGPRYRTYRQGQHGNNAETFWQTWIL
jgi:hypothetical protein